MGELIFSLCIGLWIMSLGVLIHVWMKREYKNIKQNKK